MEIIIISAVIISSGIGLVIGLLLGLLPRESHAVEVEEEK